MKNTYLIAVKKEFVRDAQFAMTLDADPMDGGDNWGDAQAELVLGTFTGDDENQAITAAVAQNMDVLPETLTTYLLADSQPKG